MFRALCGAAILALSATTASAADYAQLPAAPVTFNWTGCYVGGHLGVAASDDRTINIAGGTLDFGAAGVVGGGQVGCDHQFASNWVVGAEGRAAGASLSSHHGSNVRFPALGNLLVPSQFGLKNDFLGSVTARLGYAYGLGWLFYARGGVAWTHEKVDDAYISPAAGFAIDPSASVMRTGWTLGAGVEWAFAPSWSANVEYNYHDFGTKGPIQLISPVEGITVAHLKDTIHAATVGVNYHY
ncbi:outer membrane beta-barrel protein [Bradyrhizobium sp. OK095]|jgi:outer membrane immunogenic protein|uniref:outer membrane protein n=2 Tax=Bradyrhizobium TaxID=374 RepID=UPI0008BF8228|nr:outer membrane beta-barrel protein [Bradyrhizobium sp. OK095]SEN86360.1 outer membrane immunogenic protein [Bradyrhizobium sp. OK095]